MKGQFINITFRDVVWSEMVGTVTKSNKFELRTRVPVNPGEGWETDTDGPE